jgi:hypothetical protein
MAGHRLYEVVACPIAIAVLATIFYTPTRTDASFTVLPTHFMYIDDTWSFCNHVVVVFGSNLLIIAVSTDNTSCAYMYGELLLQLLQLLQLNINLHQRIFSTRPAHSGTMHGEKKEHADWHYLCRAGHLQTRSGSSLRRVA